MINSSKEVTCGCALCAERHEFEFPMDILDSLLARQLVIFAGAGVSTENRHVYPFTLYEEIGDELGIGPENALSFPALMSKYCLQANGRAKLLRKIRHRFDYMRGFPEVYRSAAMFHRELSTVYPIEEIITTNWDDLFERECEATPMVTAEDFAFWSMPGRKVFKIHGSVNSYGSLVVTAEDYEACYERLATGLLGSSLKMMLATKTIIFVGYSFRDDDFLSIHRVLTSEMHGLRPQSYIVTLDRDSGQRFRDAGLVPIYTDAAFFMSVLKAHLVEKGLMIPDDRFDGVSELLDHVIDKHEEAFAAVNAFEHPDVLYTLSYQDGLIHALERQLSLKKTGLYSNRDYVAQSLDVYDRRRKEKARRHVYHDVAYIDGYSNGLIYLLASDEARQEIPIFYIYGSNEYPRDLAMLIERLADAPQIHKGAHRYAEKVMKRKLVPESEISFHHTPFL